MRLLAQNLSTARNTKVFHTYDEALRPFMTNFATEYSYVSEKSNIVDKI